jgi:hypothetical protein
VGWAGRAGWLAGWLAAVLMLVARGQRHRGNGSMSMCLHCCRYIAGPWLPCSVRQGRRGPQLKYSTPACLTFLLPPCLPCFRRIAMSSYLTVVPAWEPPEAPLDPDAV